MFTVLGLILCVAIFISSLYMKKRRNYWKDRGVPELKSKHDFVSTLDYLLGRRSLEEIEEDAYNSRPNDPYVGSFDALMRPLLFVRDPKIIHHVTVTDFAHFPDRQPPLNGGGPFANQINLLTGDEWKTVSSQLTPIFSPRNLKAMYNLIEECTELLAREHFRPSSETGQPVDVKEALAKYSLDVVGKCIFGLQFNTLIEYHNLYEQVRKKVSDPGFMNTLRVHLIFAFPGWLKFLGVKLASNDVEKFFLNLLHNIKRSYRKESVYRKNALQHMLDTGSKDSKKVQDLLSDDNMVAIMFTFYWVGFEPVATALTFALYELALQPKVQEKLRREINKYREEKNGLLDYNCIKNIAYLDMVISETLRLHTPAPTNTRRCMKTYQVPGTSLVLRPGDLILYSIAAIHKDKKYFSDPMKFDPERFSAENMKNMHPYAYRAFGSGPRMCFGARFAKMEMRICLATILSRFRFSACDKTEIPITFRKGAFLHSPQNGLWLAVEEL